MSKQELLTSIVSKLVEELDMIVRAAQAAHAEATHEQSKAESKYDTRGLEASYLARGQSRQAAEMEAAIEEFRSIRPRQFGIGDAIEVGALVELDQKAERMVYFIGPRAGGTEVVYGGREILVITPQSPLGSQLLGRRAGDRFELMIGGVRIPSRVRAVD